MAHNMDTYGPTVWSLLCAFFELQAGKCIKTWTRTNPTNIDYQKPSAPETYMHGDYFLHSSRGSSGGIFKKLGSWFRKDNERILKLKWDTLNRKNEHGYILCYFLCDKLLIYDTI